MIDKYVVRAVTVTGGWDGSRVRVILHGRPPGEPDRERAWRAEVVECAAILWATLTCKALRGVQITPAGAP